MLDQPQLLPHPRSPVSFQPVSYRHKAAARGFSTRLCPSKRPGTQYALELIRAENSTGLFLFPDLIRLLIFQYRFPF